MIALMIATMQTSSRGISNEWNISIFCRTLVSHLEEYSATPWYIRYSKIKYTWVSLKPEVRDAIKLKKEACGTPEVADRYRQTKRTAVQVVLEAKTRICEEFGEAMEKDYRSASKRFGQTLRCLR